MALEDACRRAYWGGAGHAGWACRIVAYKAIYVKSYPFPQPISRSGYRYVYPAA